MNEDVKAGLAGAPIGRADASPGLGADEGRSGWGSLRLRLTLGIASALALIGLLLATVVMNQLEHDHTAVVFAGQNSNARSMATLIQREAEFRLRALDALARAMPAERWTDARQVQAFLNDKPLAQTLFRRDVYVISAAGRRIAEVPVRGGIGMDYAGSGYVQRVLASGKPVVVPLIGRLSRKPNLIFAVPVLDANGKVVAIVCGSEELQPGSAFYISDFARNGDMGGYYIHAANERVTVASTDESRVLQPLPAHGVNALLDRRLEQGFDGPARTRNLRGVEVLSEAERIESLNWVVVSYASAEEVLAPLHRLNRTILAGTALATLAGTLIAWWILGRLLRPLTTAARAIGQLDASKPIPRLQESGSSEIRALLQHFNELHQVIEVQRQALQVERERLELTVAERTRSLADAERFVRTITNAMPSVIGYWDAGQRVRYGNQANQLWFGADPELLPGTQVRDLLGVERYAQAEPHILRALGGETQAFECAMTRADGLVVHCRTHFIPDSIDDQVRGIFVLITDITEARQAEEAQRRLADELDDLYNQSPSGYHSLAPDGTILRINDTELAWLGYDREELVGRRRVQQLLAPDSLETFAAEFPRLLAGERLSEIEVDFVRKDGTTYPALISATPVLDAEGRFISSRSVVVDFSSLREQQHTLRRVLSAAPMAVRIADMFDGRILFMNQAFLRLTGRGMQEMLDLDIRKLYCDPAVIADIHRRLDAGETVLNRLVELHAPDRPERPHVWALASYTVIAYEGRRSMLSWMYDVTEMQQARADAEAATRAKGDFLSNMSHEIRTPLHAVLGLAQLLQRQALDAPTRTLVRKIRGAGRTLQAIISDILDFSRLEADRLVIEQAPFRLSDVLDNLATIMTSNQGDKRLELVLDPPPAGIDWVVGDALRLEQVLINLTSNAIKFTARGHVRVAIRAVAQDAASCRLRFVVEDTGIGLDEAAQQRIFQPFVQADSSTTRRYGGTGLGLAISRRLTELMGGEMGVQSTPGQGSRFWLTLPLGLTTGEPATPAQEEVNVLIVDDSPVALDAMRRCAASLGWSVTCCASGSDALDHARRARQAGLSEDVLVLDWDMPALDGIQTASAICRLSPGAPAPVVIMVTALAREEFLDAPGADIADAVLSKPVTTASLGEAVYAALRARRADVAPDAQAAGSRSQQRLAGLRLLVVDDSEINREVAQALLAGEGASVAIAPDGYAALAWLDASAGAVDLVLLDMQMPGLDGIAVMQQIRERPVLGNVPVVALSAGVLKEQREAALAAGMADFIPKPFEIDRAVDQILRAMGRSTAAGAPAAPLPATSAESGHSTLLIERGLQIFKSEPVYKRWLRRFAEDNRGFAERVATLEVGVAGAEFHKLKGVAANLGMPGLAELASGMEAAARGGSFESRRLAMLQAELEQVLATIDAYAGPVPAEEGIVAKEGVEGLAPLLERALAALAQDRPDALEPVLAELRQFLSEKDLRRLQEAVEGFDFRGAEIVVKALKTATSG